MTSQPQPAAGEGRTAGQYLRPLRDLAAWALVGAPAVLLFVAIIRLIPAGDGEQFASRTQDSFYSFVNLPTIFFPLGAVLLALLVHPRHPKAKVITVLAAVEYAVAAFFAVVFGILVGLIQIVEFSVRTAFEELLVRAAWLAVFGLAAFAVYRIWRGLFYVPKPQPQPGVYGQPQYGVPGTYPGQPGYGTPPGYAPQPGQPGWNQPGYGQQPQYGQPPIPPGAAVPPGPPGAPVPVWGQQPPAATQPVSAQPAAAQPVSAQPSSGQPFSAQSSPGQPYAAQPYSAQPFSAQPFSAQPFSAQPGSGQPGSGQAGSGQPGSGHAGSGQAGSGPAGSGPADSGAAETAPPGPFAPGQAPAYPAGSYGTPSGQPSDAFSEPTQVVPQHEPATTDRPDDRTQVVRDERPGFGPADEDQPRR